MTPDPDAPRIVTTAANEAEAALMVSHLASHGIKALISGAHTRTAWPEVPTRIQVVVRQADVERAREALQSVAHAQCNEDDSVEGEVPSIADQRHALRQTGEMAGWDDPEMDVYDHP